MQNRTTWFYKFKFFSYVTLTRPQKKLATPSIGGKQLIATQFFFPVSSPCVLYNVILWLLSKQSNCWGFTGAAGLFGTAIRHLVLVPDIMLLSKMTFHALQGIY